MPLRDTAACSPCGCGSLKLFFGKAEREPQNEEKPGETTNEGQLRNHASGLACY